MSSIIKRADGGVSLSGFTGTVGEMEAFLARWASSARSVWLPATIESFSGELPGDRSFRNAWEADGANVAVNMVKARSIHRDRMRALRRPLLEALDVEYQKADEQGDHTKKREIAARKQILRDVTANSAIDSATTPEQLAAVWPEVLQA